MIKSANQYPVHTLLSHDGNTHYRVPPYQREYSWQKHQWEELFDDLVEAEAAHFLGTIICLDSTTDHLQANILEVIDGQQRLTTITLLMAAVHSVLAANRDSMDDDARADLANLRRQLVRRQDNEPHLRPQRQGHNLEDYGYILKKAGLPVEAVWVAYMPSRRVARCYEHFLTEISDYAEAKEISLVEGAQQILAAVNQAILVKIEVDTHADAFVLFESLNNRGMPLTPVDLIKNHLLAESERRGVMNVDAAFGLWNEMLANLGDSYSTQERFLRHYFNAFRSDLPSVSGVTVATRSNLIRIYETLVGAGVPQFVDGVVRASRFYGRITGQKADDGELDRELARLGRAQGAPCYVLLLFLLSRAHQLNLTEDQTVTVTRLLTNFFVRRNLTGFPQTYALPRLFIDLIDEIQGASAAPVPEIVAAVLERESVGDDAFRERLEGPVYADNADVTRFILVTLAEDAMTRESWQDLWARDKNTYAWTIEHILPQGTNLPESWQAMLGGQQSAREAQEAHAHRLGNLTITGYNSTLSNKAFENKRDRTDSAGRPIGYRNGLRLNEDVANQDAWSVEQIETRTQKLAGMVLARFPLGL